MTSFQGFKRFLRGVRAAYPYMRDGHGFGNGRLYSLKAAIGWSRRVR